MTVEAYRKGRRSLAWLCWEAAGGDPWLALLLALDAPRLIREAKR